MKQKLTGFFLPNCGDGDSKRTVPCGLRLSTGDGSALFDGFQMGNGGGGGAVGDATRIGSLFVSEN